MINEIYLDMDGVLTNWDYQVDFYNARKETGKANWDKIHKIGAKFWIDMPWLVEGHDLYLGVLELQKKYNFKMSSVDKDLKEQATLEKDGLEAELSKAWINGMLDSVFATKAQEEISAFMKEASELRDATNDDELREILDSSYSSLKTLYDKFGSF